MALAERARRLNGRGGVERVFPLPHAHALGGESMPPMFVPIPHSAFSIQHSPPNPRPSTLPILRDPGF